jgi:asparagine synthase (glutamine-hydrolysing)
MCGVAGAFGPPGREKQLDDVRAMTAALLHRGPDGGDVWHKSEAGVTFGHRRLAIIDLTPTGAQPMHSACGRYTITFNGEIYNHAAMRAELNAAGKAPVWRGGSDTETLLAAIAAYGVEAALAKSVGMFAWGLWDHETQTLTLARDRFGEKPLYFGLIRTGRAPCLVFGSELKALQAHPDFANRIDVASVAAFLRHSYVPAPHSIFQDVRKLTAGSFVRIDREGLDRGTFQEKPYWRYMDVVKAGLAAPFASAAEGEAAIEAALSDAIGLQLVADVPVGAFLSGGIDSSTIVALAQRQSRRTLKTFTVGFTEFGYNEAPFAAAVAKHFATDHTEVTLSAADALAVIPLLSWMYDEPFGDSSQIPTYLISKVAREAVTVALSGDAGDELFGGYTRYFIAPPFWRQIKPLPSGMRHMAGRTMSLLSVSAWDKLAQISGADRRITNLGDKAHRLANRLETVHSIDDLFKSMLLQWSAGNAPTLTPDRDHQSQIDDASWAAALSNPEQRMMLVDALTYLPDDILVKVDRAAMAVSLETRVPFLDHRIAELAWRIPIAHNIHGGSGKHILRNILGRHAPRSLFERAKAGFGVPIGAWLLGPLRDWAEDLLSEASLRDHGLLNVQAVRKLWSEHVRGSRDWTPRLWNILMLQAWLANHNRIATARG